MCGAIVSVLHSVKQDERYAAGAGMRRSGFFQVGTVFVDERYIAIEHMDVRRDCVSFARLFRCLPGRQGGMVSCFMTCREPIHGGASSTSCLARF